MPDAETIESLVSQLAVISAAVVAAVFDVRQFRIPNRLTVPLLTSGIVFHGIVGGIAGIASSFVGLSFGFAVMILLYVIGASGAGDVKLMAGVGAWLGMPGTLYVFVVGALATAVYSLVVLVGRGGVRRALVAGCVVFWQLRTIGKHLADEDRIEMIARQPDRRKRLVPFAITVAAGAVAVGATAAPMLVQAAPGRSLAPPAVAIGLILMGMLVQIHAKLVLGRSMGCVAANRGLKFSGPYRFLRHPMYAGYLLGHVGFLLMNPTPLNAGLYLACLTMQVWRILVEERLLGRDPRYLEYAATVRFRLVPRVF